MLEVTRLFLSTSTPARPGCPHLRFPGRRRRAPAPAILGGLRPRTPPDAVMGPTLTVIPAPAATCGCKTPKARRELVLSLSEEARQAYIDEFDHYCGLVGRPGHAQRRALCRIRDIHPLEGCDFPRSGWDWAYGSEEGRFKCFSPTSHSSNSPRFSPPRTASPSLSICSVSTKASEGVHPAVLQAAKRAARAEEAQADRRTVVTADAAAGFGVPAVGCLPALMGIARIGGPGSRAVDRHVGLDGRALFLGYD